MHKLVPENAVLIPPQATPAFEGIIYTVYHWEQKRFDGSGATFEMLKRPDTVTIMGMADDKLVVIDDHQPHAGSIIGFPGGRVDPTDKTTLAVAKREMREETGYEFKHWRLIQAWQPFVKIEWFVHVYLAWDVTAKGAPENDPGEKIEVKLMSFEETSSLAKQKVGYLGEARDILEQAQNLSGLLALPEFKGQAVDR